MNLFDSMVSVAMKNRKGLSALRIVVEKEILHHDILREMSKAGMLEGLVFIGGTCLRACYGANRLSEDLDFAGGSGFEKKQLVNLGSLLVDRLHSKYNLTVDVSDPVKDTGNVKTWKIKIITRPHQRSLPQQRIHIDICAIPSYDPRPMTLINHYGVELGTSGLILQAQSLEEIFADKIVAFALRPNRIKNRDLWDIGWLKQQNISLPMALVGKKIIDHNRTVAEFVSLLESRSRALIDDSDVRKDFISEMRRFLPTSIVSETIENESFWNYLVQLVNRESSRVIEYISGYNSQVHFKM